MSWPVVALGQVADTALGKMLDKGNPKGNPHVPYLRNINVRWGRIDTDDILTMELADAERARFGVQPGDLLICEGGEPGRCAIWTGPSDYMAFQKALHRVRPAEGLNPRFLRYLLQYYSETGALASHTTGSTIAHLPQQQLRQLPIPLPHVDDQRRIVEILEDHLSRLDAAETDLALASRRADALRRSALGYSFDTGSTGQPLSAAVSAISSGRSFGTAQGPAGPDDWGIIKVSAMTWGSFNAAQNKKVDASEVNPALEIKSGDLLVSRANTSEYVGAAVIVREVRPRLLLSDKSLRLTPRDGVSPEWLCRVLQSPPVRRQMSTLATGTKDSMRNISQKSLLSIIVPSATFEQQQAAIRHFDAWNSLQEHLSASTQVNLARCHTLRQATLAAAFEGKLTGTRTHVEVIEELADA